MTTYSFQWERRDSNGQNPVDIVGANQPTYVVTAADVGHTIGLRASDGVNPPLEAIPTAVVGAVSSHAYHGSRIDGQFYVDKGYGPPNADDAPWSANEAGGSWDLFEQHIAKKISCVHYGGPGGTLPGTNSQPGFDTAAVTLAYSRGAFPLYTFACSTQQMLDLAANSNVHGTLAAVDAMATAIQSVGKALLLRPPWEMNANWSSPFPWQTSQGVSAAQFVAAWQTMVNRIRAITSLASFVWCPNVMNGGNAVDPTPWWPGGAYVDWPAVDGYLQSTSVFTSPPTLFNATFAKIRGLPGAAGKPLAICETGCAAPTGAPGKTQWIADLFSWLASPAGGGGADDVKLLCWFNESGDPQWPHVEVGDAASTLGGPAQAQYAASIGNARWLANVAGGFTPGQPVPVP